MDIESIQTKLKAKGCRQSKVRMAMLRLLDDHGILSVDVLLELLAETGIHPNKTTIYRELDLLVEASIVNELNFGESKKRYELSDTDHHHHLFCQHCEKILCVPIGAHLASVERQLEVDHNFIIQSHHLEFFGLCEDCR